MYSIPDKNKVSKEEWDAYIEAIANHKPTEQGRVNYQLMNDSILFGEEYMAVDSTGNIRRIHPMSDEAQEIRERIYNAKNI